MTLPTTPIVSLTREKAAVLDLCQQIGKIGRLEDAITSGTKVHPMTTLSPAAQAVHCPVCGVAAEPKRYGPFFIDPVYRVAMTCPHHHWRGRMCETTADAIAAELEAQP